MDWFRSLRILLRMESKDYVLEEPINELAPDANEEERNAWEQHVSISLQKGIIITQTGAKYFTGFYEGAS